MKAKEYLQKLQRLDTVINQKIAELNDLRMKAEGVGSIDYARDKVQTSPAADAPFANMVGQIADLKAEIGAEIEKYMHEKHRIINQIQALENSRHIEILYKRYVEFKSLEAIAAEMRFTYQYIVELHGCALREFQTTYKNLYNPM